jgi:hypothetical protein
MKIWASADRNLLKQPTTRQGPRWKIDESAGDQNLRRCTNVSVK